MAPITVIIAAQLYTIRHQITSVAALSHALQQLAEIGYRGVELGGMRILEGPQPELSVPDLKRMLDDAGLQCVGTHKRWREIRDHTSHVTEMLHSLECTTVTIPAFDDDFDRFDPASYTAFATESMPITADLASNGIRLAYHNHAHEFLRFGPDRRNLLDILIDQPSLAIEIDVYWAAFAGINPEHLIQRLPGRQPLLHCKDLEIVCDDGLPARPVDAPVGEGNLNWTRILEASGAAGTGVWVVEQDECRRDPFDCLRSSYNFLSCRANWRGP